MYVGLKMSYFSPPVPDGNVCLNILREDWKPVLTINSIVYGLQYLFLEPNPDDPLNKEAATELQANRDKFNLNLGLSNFMGRVQC